MDRMSDQLFDAISRGIRLGRQISQSEAEHLMAAVEYLRQQLAAKDATICGLKEGFDELHRTVVACKAKGKCNIAYWEIESAGYAFLNIPTCQHKEEVKRLKADYEGACKTIADMHAAAVGEVTGPKRGVVEDVADLQAQLASLREVVRALTYMADEKNWDQEDGQYRFVRPGGFKQEGIFMVSRNLNPWLFAANALRFHESKWGKVEKEGTCQECCEGWTCEKHPGTPWPHALPGNEGTCAGPGMPCQNRSCLWRQQNFPGINEEEEPASLVGTAPIICEGCGGEINPDYGRCQRCG